MENLFSWLPSVEEVLNNELFKNNEQISHAGKTEAIRQVLTTYRWQIKNQGAAILADCPNPPALKNKIVADALALAKENSRTLLHPVVNGTGIVLHTNLGRAPLAKAAQDAVCNITGSYCNLEIDMVSGNRSLRYQNVEKLICDLTGAEACLIVNNNAAAMLLALETMAKGKEGIISRGQLVEIGGSFRVPEVMEKSGVILKEVGTTNKTNLADYANALSENTGILLIVHPSNFHITGFVEQPAMAEIVELGHQHQVPTLYDWGCGALYPLAELKIGREQTIKKIMATGVDVVTFSGDKLLGGPQCGIIIGKKAEIAAMQKNPFTRALRVDKMVLAALEGTLRCYDDQVTALREIPILRQLTKPLDELKALAEEIQGLLQAIKPNWEITVKEGFGEVGGGSLPETNLPTYLVCIKPNSKLHSLAAALRVGNPAVLGYIKDGFFNLDTRTLLEKDTAALQTAF